MKYLALGMLLALAASTVHAKTIDMRANIPFAFRVGDSVMPAGDAEDAPASLLCGDPDG